MNSNVRELTLAEVDELVLPLRMRTFYTELEFTRGVVEVPSDTRDEFDGDAVHLGCFLDGVFAGSVRLIVRDLATALPSGPFVPAGVANEGKVGELSRGQVAPEFRRHGCFTKLLKAARDRAAEVGVRHLILSTYVEREAFLVLGFKRVGRPFRFSDVLLKPNVEAWLYHAAVPHDCTSRAPGSAGAARGAERAGLQTKSEQSPSQPNAHIV